jgi:hypothetical protein
VNRLILFPMLLIATQIGRETQATPDLWAGVWKLNIAASTFHGDAPMQETVKVAPAGSDTLAFSYAVTVTKADGGHVVVTYNGRKDGKPYPHFTDGKQTSEVSYTRESSRLTSCQITYSDGSTGTETLTLSSDGKSFTVHQHVNAKAGAYDETHVFEKA